MTFLDNEEEIKASSAASSDEKVDIPSSYANESAAEQPVKSEPVQEVKQSQPTNEEPLYSKQALVDYGSFSLVDRAILKMVVSDTEKITQEEAQAKINEYKGVK